MSQDINQIREHVIGLLDRGPVEITFTKVNGETRVMPCTLNKDLVPIHQSKGTREKRHSLEVQSVWCLDKKEWRSFRWDRFISAKEI
ncbi:MAG: SH3 beta-barrel fold-containing protein [Fischerella sp.]|nr:SH3 beta-barrel fold-containing protein [Fischerella sp.]